jgi:hypothetical protein
MTDRKRSPLPEGYQFGDARPKPSIRFPWPPFEVTAADMAELASRQAEYLKPWADALADRAVNWNVIEGDEH